MCFAKKEHNRLHDVCDCDYSDDIATQKERKSFTKLAITDSSVKHQLQVSVY